MLFSWRRVGVFKAIFMEKGRSVSGYFHGEG